MKYLPINWQDGMKIRRQHLLGQELAQRAEMHDLAQAQITPHNYGLLPPRPGESARAFDLYFKLDQTGQMGITLSACRLLAPTGAYFELTREDEACTLQATVVQVQERFPQVTHCYVVLEVNPYDRQPTGGADPEEHPPRLRFTQPRYRLKLAQVMQGAATPQGAFDFTLGRIDLSGAEPRLDESLVPACTNYHAHPNLQEQFDQWMRGLGEIEDQARQTLNRIRSLSEQEGDDLFGNNLDVAPMAHRLSVHTMYLSGDLLAQAEWFRYQPPVLFFTALQRHARSLRNTFAQLGATAIKDWMNFLIESLKLNDYKDSIEQMVGHKYQHEELGQAVQVATQYLQMLGRLYHPQRGLPVSNFAWRQIDNNVIRWEDRGSDEDPNDIF